MSYQVYKVLHLVGAFMIVLALGAMLTNSGRRKLAGATHGIGLAISLVAGFGLLAKLGYGMPTQGWSIAKIVIWLILGGFMALIRRFPEHSASLWWTVLLLASLAGYLGVYKPF